MRAVVLQPGGSTGGTTTTAGILTHSDADRVTSQTYHGGQSFIEPKTSANVHIGRDLGRAGRARSPDPGCGFA